MRPHLLSLNRKSKPPKEDPEKKTGEDKKTATLDEVVPRANRSLSYKASRLVFSRDARQQRVFTKLPDFESEGADFTIDHSSSLTVERNEPVDAHRIAIIPIVLHAETPDPEVVMDTADFSGETHASSRGEVSSDTASDRIPQNSSASSGSSKGAKGKLVRESRQVYEVGSTTPSHKVAEMVSVILQNKLGSEMGTVRVLKMMYCATGGKIKIDRLQPETGSCALKLSNLQGHFEKLEHVDALYVKLEYYLTPTQRQVISRYIDNIKNFRYSDAINRDCSILLLNDYLRAELIKLGVQMNEENPI
ncbi:hypothetical protein [Variovorax sp. B2]|uniref:hypothetical protein n=1 Tax=Variovorax sp. B2 TaxID=2021406 RepID=UPI000B2C7A12|nr:hypothetical protein [Variovorax sp. B2]PNG47482.1 hypothetical protein CHC06_07832 [Variovorax sp. B2]